MRVKFKLDGTFQAWGTVDSPPQRIEAKLAYQDFDLMDDRDAAIKLSREIADQFPKSLKVKPSLLHTTGGYKPFVQLVANLTANGVNGGINETGLRRYRSFRKNAEKLGIEIEWAPAFRNSYPTEQQFERAVA